MTQTTTDIVQRLWSLCDVLRDDGVTYHQYVTELTYLLFLKMAEETGAEQELPDGYRWRDLTVHTGLDQLNFYKALLLHLGTAGSQIVQEIYANAGTVIRRPNTLTILVKALADLDWYSAKEEGLGDLYEGLLAKKPARRRAVPGSTSRPGP